MTYDWVKIKTEYMTNRTITPEDLAIKYGGDVKYFQNKSSEEKWREEREEIWKRSGEKVMQKLPDKIADVKLRHIQIAKAMQNVMLQRLRNGNIDSKSTYSDLKTAIDIERDALGLNDKKTTQELQQLSQFNFILNLKPDELRRFIKSAERRASITSGSNSQDGTAEVQQDGGSVNVDTIETSR